MKKTKLYLGMTGGFGSLSQTLPIIEKLDKNHFEIYCNINHGAADAVKKLGMKFIEFPAVPLTDKLTPKGATWWDIDHYWGRFGYRDYEYVKRIIDIRLNKITEIGIPDLMMTQFCPPTEILSRILKVPLICVTQSCMHPAGLNVNWWKKPDEKYPRVTDIVNKVLQDYNCSLITRMEDLNRGDLTFIPSIPEFDPVNDDEAVYIGPLSWNSSNNINSQFEIDKIDLNKKIIFVYTGHLRDSAGNSGELILENCIKALSNKPWEVIISTGLGQSEIKNNKFAPNIHVYNWIQVDKIINKVSLIIHHGGHGSSMLSINHGIPALVIPTFSERQFNARQLEKLKIGEYILPEDLTPDILEKKVYECINNSILKYTAEKWKNKVDKRNYKGADEVTSQIDSFLNNRN